MDCFPFLAVHCLLTRCDSTVLSAMTDAVQIIHSSALNDIIVIHPL